MQCFLHPTLYYPLRSSKLYSHKNIFQHKGFILCVSTSSYGESSTCLTVYKEGGAPAVFQSPKCPRWKLPDYGSDQWSNGRCQTALHRGRRKSQEDRILCALDIRIPFPGGNGITEVTVGVVAVFDGHNGAEASEMASKLLLQYFTLHTFFLLDATFSVLSRKMIGLLPNERGQSTLRDLNGKLDELNFGRLKLTVSSIIEQSFHLEILREALLRAIDDIDSAFSRDAFRHNFDSGSTATVILMAENQILVANIGDSKAFLCSEEFKSQEEAKANLLRLYRQNRGFGIFEPVKNFRSFKLAAPDQWPFLIANELTRDHHPDRDDERSRVETAGGHVSKWGGVARVNGQLAVSRAIGDVYFKSYGVISAPEVTDWQPLTGNDCYLVAASDGVLEKLSSQDICDILWTLHADFSVRSELVYSCSYSLADCIVNAAFEKGSMDNMAAVILPVRWNGSTQTVVKKTHAGIRKFDCSSSGDSNYISQHSVLSGEEDGHPPLASNFGRLLVEGKHSGFGCFYLSENLDVNDEYTFWVQKDIDEYEHELLHALPDSIGQSSGGALDLYNDQHMCVHFGMNFSDNEDQCINPEGFARFLGLLESIPFNDSSTSDHARADSRYILKKKYDRGSYGEVWLAFYWNCSHVIKSPRSSNFSANTMDEGANNERRKNPSSADVCDDGPSEGSMFILKRIMVEKGTSVYLSGLREKYFGELFLNAHTVLGGSLQAEDSNSLLLNIRPDLHDPVEINESADLGRRRTLRFNKVHGKKEDMLRAAFEDGLNHIARYVESFESRSNEIWLVFRHEGRSLSKLLYTAEEVINNSEGGNENIKHIQILHPSKWWKWLKTTEAGREETRNLIWQLLMALKSCHDRNITHRDIKPENMVVCFEDQDSGRCLKGYPNEDKSYITKMRIIDFGSAVDEFTLKHLYGSIGPSRAEQTYEYTAPEALLNASWYEGLTPTTMKYDMWSVGVVILELVLGTPDVFQVSSRTRALLDQHLEGWNESLKELAYKLRSFMEMCILSPGVTSKLHETRSKYDQASASPAPWKCSEEFFSRQIKNRDPLKIGFPNIWLLRLVRELLQWNPEDRPSVDEALKHPYFSQR
ncbi:uncharacterized protein LOC132610787 isoform X1 [Lycium barbarum]|uniref:uncharacterized protein LOC132610787 isoform X1 n=3 Tax=Lycium barbarum TaxID=112863 RepID=UPI00293EB664|nr:uncharacterized protein LOC132610787 isoform X1 [Lycium barbarum]XP_060181147.1 uncharacterized protein LOC132610787 isoform X1 [Lycium barbarum]XP_060181148.1 uncharacterized protein LOC132610787 isoform X1 [Lycium barbarum]XP_060181149.1 uncharacterized protein LOC132610787 isoform X1 [Lycium barbarum]XP_060181150.1 uncharacterized protein LOC132610787 isoform X1 [Lycium barbarum]XP_060181151.1 uncharacterized protein LOC132610787 isoform X1 [Lycium barbarum]XP_060181153.1 uncharacterize